MIMEYTYLILFIVVISGTLHMLTYGCTRPQADDAPEAYRLAAQDPPRHFDVDSNPQRIEQISI